MNIQKHSVAALAALSVALLFNACEKKSEAEKLVDKVENKVKDATDSRPAEGLRDTLEDARDAVKN